MPRRPFILEQHPDPLPYLVVDRGPDGKGVGRWVPEQKHFLLAKYIRATCYARAKWQHRIFLDPFCGPGRIQVKDEAHTRDGGTLVAWHASKTGGGDFSNVLVGDLAKDRVDACAARLHAVGGPVRQFEGSAIETVSSMVEQVPTTKALTFAYLDPYNLEYLSFSIIEELAKLNAVDFAVHFSTMDLTRNVELEFDPSRARFDDSAPGWRENVDVRASAKAGVSIAFFNYWCGLVRDLGFEFSKEMPLVYNDRGNPIYRLVFFSRHPLPNRVWADVAKGPNRELGF